jgi:uncharacterized protein YcbX
MGLAAAEIFTNFLADQNPDEGIRDVRLFVAPQNRPGRTVRDAYQFEGASRRVNGADGAAILAVNEATLGWMQDQYHFTDEYIDILRARANLVLTGLEPMEEDFIGAVTINGRRLVNVGPSGRCVETGVDPRTGERDDNRFLKVLGQAGRKGWSASSHDPGLMFGINLQPEPSQDLTPVSVGDAFTVEWTSGSNILYEKPKGLG